MTQHKWHKEIKAWADGAEIEDFIEGIWLGTEYPAWDSADYKFRIKPQPKEKKYLYAYQNVDGNCELSIFKNKYNGQKPIGKIKLEVDDD